MHKVYRQILLAVISLIFFISTCSRCRQRQQETHSWTPQLEQQMRDVFYAQSARLAINETERNQFADCCLEKMKDLFPNGISSMDANMSDSVKVAIMKMGADCVTPLKSDLNIWSPDVIEQFKLNVYSAPETKLLPQKMKKEYVDCITYKVMAKFPQGLKEGGKDSLKAFLKIERTKCLKLLINKYGKTAKNRSTPDSASNANK